MPFGLPVRPRQGDCRGYGRLVLRNAVGEGGDEADPSLSDPRVEFIESLAADDALELQDDVPRLHENGDAALDRRRRERFRLGQPLAADCQKASDGASGWSAGECGRVRFFSPLAPSAPFADNAETASESALFQRPP